MSFDPISAAFDIGGKLIDRLWPNPSERDAAKLKLMELQQSGELAKLAAETELAKGQLEINVEEAKSDSLFVSGWRPFVGWVCGSAFAYHFIFQPLIIFSMAVQGRVVQTPSFDMDALFTVLLGLLGLGGFRTFEKVKGAVK